jgi:hypothetical protein
MRKDIDPHMGRLADNTLLSSLFLLSLLLSGSDVQGQLAPRQCGFDRWPVKILADQDRSRVDLEPINTTVAELGAIPIHEIPYPYNERIHPEELHVYRVQARLLRVRHEKDSDLHLLLADLNDESIRMIAEIPAPECAEGTGHEEEYRKARAAVKDISFGSVIEVVGVGFFDFLHEQKGAAKNGVELHPVLRVTLAKWGECWSAKSLNPARTRICVLPFSRWTKPRSRPCVSPFLTSQVAPLQRLSAYVCVK